MLNLSKFRKEAGLSQSQLGEACGWGDKSQSRVSHYESGRRSPSIDDLRLMISKLNAAGVDCDINDLFEDTAA